MKFIIEFDADEFIGSVEDGSMTELCKAVKRGRAALAEDAVDTAQIQMDLPAAAHTTEPNHIPVPTPEPVNTVASPIPGLTNVETAPDSSPVPDIQAEPVPIATTATTYTISQIQAACGPLLTAGKGPELHSLLGKYGVDTLTSVPTEKLGLFAADLRAMGAQI